MSYIGPVCVASNGNTLYAVVTSGYGDSEVVILARSNVAPSSLDALTWTAVASTYQKTLTTISGISMDTNVECHVDNQGVFTLLSMFSKSPIDRPSGYQYSPTTKAWTNIATTPGYKWGNAAGKALFTVNGSSSTLMHIYLGTALDGSNIAVFNPKTRIMTEGKNPWVTRGAVSQYTAANGAIYVTSYNISTGAVYLNMGTVSANGAPPVSTKVVTLDIGTCIVYGNNVKTVLREGLYYLYCGNTDLVNFRWFTFDGTKQSASSPAITNARRSAKGFLPLGPAGKPPTWAFLYDALGLVSVTMKGSKAGEWRDAKYKFNISGTIPKPKPVSAKRFSSLDSENGSGAGAKIFLRAVGGGTESHGGIEENGLGSGGLSIGALAGIVGSAVVVLGVVVFGVWRRRKAQPKQI
ncbi:hypothetical protein BGZ96_005040 [Linnemannia gamsii]|uniref:Uncharacterized protein n=1 Tax=Linnemannia gamsii TaxID=64522 RepID=A0ABQ7K4U6_9FUNG|nr:hypothetical protein BGZ96_005040 [Linnemannia gamsii]